MKKISIIFLACVLICVFMIPALAAEDIYITYPVDKSIVEDETSAVSFNSVAGMSAVIYLNGNEIASVITEEENVINLPDTMPLGENLLKIYVYGDNISETAESRFEVRKTEYTQNNIEKFDGGLGNFEIADGMEKGELGTDNEGNKTYISLTYDMDGPDGSKAVGFYANGNITVPKDVTRFFNKSFSGAFKSGIWVIRYDIKLFSKTHFFMESKNGETGEFPFLGGKEFLTQDGMIAATGECYPVGEWMNVTHTIDIDRGVQTHTVSWKEGEAEKNVSYTTNDANAAQLVYLRPTAVFKVLKGEGEHGVLIDNFEVGTKYIYGGFAELSYIDGDGNEKECAENLIKSDKVTKIKLRCEYPYFKNMDITENITATANGVQRKINSAVIDEKGEFMIVDFIDPLPSQAEITMNFEVRDSKNEVELSFIKNFSTEYIEFGINELVFKNNEKKLMLSRQLKASDTVTVSASFKNVVEDKNVVFITALYKGDEIISISAQEVESKKNRRKTVTETITIPDDGKDFNIECYLFDSFLSRIPISKIWTLK